MTWRSLNESFPNKTCLVLNHEIRNHVLFMRMKLEINRRKTLNSRDGLGREKPVSLHLQAQRSAVDSVPGQEKRERRKPGTILSLAVDGIKVAGEEVRMDGGGSLLTKGFWDSLGELVGLWLCSDKMVSPPSATRDWVCAGNGSQLTESTVNLPGIL